ncbi:hypothetical protein BpHYR1_014551 [Brachionus plicatilis]|uniref:Uncharacterized protein n=1 Tax=Brachionus plicatilis TaxID=10195 RepID=A0A3M7PUN3_BRAPC|nr:hypothetical protein BpHYR1_014551 [Brachionus plicatilis]
MFRIYENQQNLRFFWHLANHCFLKEWTHICTINLTSKLISILAKRTNAAESFCFYLKSELEKIRSDKRMFLKRKI